MASCTEGRYLKVIIVRSATGRLFRRDRGNVGCIEEKKGMQIASKRWSKRGFWIVDCGMLAD